MAGEEAGPPCHRAAAVRGPTEVTVRVWIGAVARPSRSPPWPSRATLRWPVEDARSAAVRALNRAPHRARCLSWRMLATVRGPQDVAAVCPTSLPEPVHEPVRTRPTTAPTVSTRSALRAALSQANFRPSSTLSIDRTSCAPRAWCGSRLRPETGPCSSSVRTSRAILRHPSRGERSVVVRASRLPCIKLAARLAGRLQRCAVSSSRRRCCSPGSLPEPVHEAAMTRRTGVPTLGTRSALRVALGHAKSLPTSWPSIDRTPCAPRAHGDAGAGRNLCPATRGSRTS